MENIRAFSDKIKNRVEKNSSINLVYLIGSHAHNTERLDSDIDIIVVARDITQVSYEDLYGEIDQCIEKSSLDLRIIIPNETDPLFLFEVIKNGILLYCKDTRGKMFFEWYAIKMYYDSQYIRNIYRKYLDQRFKAKTYGK